MDHKFEKQWDTRYNSSSLNSYAKPTDLEQAEQKKTTNSHVLRPYFLMYFVYHSETKQCKCITTTKKKLQEITRQILRTIRIYQSNIKAQQNKNILSYRLDLWFPKLRLRPRRYTTKSIKVQKAIFEFLNKEERK